MKNQPLVAVVLTVSSWFGNLTLTGLAFYLVFTQKAPLTPITFITMAICILLGNALPLAAYLIQLWWRQAELRAEGMDADLTLRGALMLGESLTERLEELSDSTAKGVLVAKQIPEKVRERTKKLELLLTNLEDGNLEAALERLEKLTTQDREQLTGLLESISAKLDLYESRLPFLEKRIEDESKQISKKADKHAEISKTERVQIKDLLEAIIDQLKSSSTPSNKGKTTSIDKVTSDDDDEWSGDFLEDEVEIESDEPIAEASIAEDGEVPDFEDVEEAKPESETILGGETPDQTIKSDLKKGSTEGPQKENKKKPSVKEKLADFPFEIEEAKALPKDNGQFVMDLETDPKLKSTGTQIYVQAIIGISNKLYLRGDEPYLSWEKGTPLELVGIGEYQWKPDGDIDRPITFKLILNDEKWADGENLTLKPGETLRLKPRF